MRAKLRAVLVLASIVFTTSLSAAALCGLECLDHVEPAGCHTSPQEPTLSDCCATEAPPAAGDASLPEALSLSRGLQPISTPALDGPSAPAVAFLTSHRRSGVPLFTLHRSLLL